MKNSADLTWNEQYMQYVYMRVDNNDAFFHKIINFLIPIGVYSIYVYPSSNAVQNLVRKQHSFQMTTKTFWKNVL